jgi:hypothetical protein
MQPNAESLRRLSLAEVNNLVWLNDNLLQLNELFKPSRS